MTCIWRVEKKTGNYADSLVAIGMADLLKEIAGSKTIPTEAIIRDEGESYCVEVTPSVDLDALRSWTPVPGYPFIKDKPNIRVPPGFSSIDYVREKEVGERYKKAQAQIASNKQSRKKTKVAITAVEPPAEPRSDLNLLKAYNSLRMTSNSYKELFCAIAKYPEELRRQVGKRLGLVSMDQINEEAQNGVFRASSLAFFSPTSGKGIHLTKPRGTGRGALPDPLVDWFDEWMKYRAMHLGMLAYFTGSDGKDNKVLVLAPADISLAEVMTLREALFKQKQVWGSTRSDILAILFLTEQLIRHSKEYDISGGLLSFLGKTPPQILGGLYSAYFKSVGNAKAIMNVSFMGLPEWFPVETNQDAEDWLAVIAEHRQCIQAMSEERSEDIALLLLYRTFLSSGDLGDCLEFFASYAPWLMQKKANQDYARDFTTNNIRRMLTMYKLEEIVGNQGFQNMATSVRKATINQQYQKSITGTSPFEIRYGLAQDWKRRVRYPQQFICALSDFVQSFNSENARHAEQGRKTRANVTTEDLEQVISLIEKHGSELVGMLLLAFGYARDPHEPETSSVHAAVS